MPSFETLASEADLGDDAFDPDSIDFSDLREKYNVQRQQGLDAFVLVDGLPEVGADKKSRLAKVLVSKVLTTVGKIREDTLHIPVDEENKTKGFAFVEYTSVAEAAAAIRQLDNVKFDAKHTLRINKLTDVDRYGRGDRVGETFVPPQLEEYKETENLLSFLDDPADRGRNQFVMHRGDTVAVFWNNEKDDPDLIIERQQWTDSFAKWSPRGTYLTSAHVRGVQLWGGESWHRRHRFAHPFVERIVFSPNERYLITWSARPISVPDEGIQGLTAEDNGMQFVIWEVDVGRALRSFKEPSQPDMTDEMISKQRMPPGPDFKWSADSKYVARLTPGQSISVYELPHMSLLDKSSIKVEGAMDFEWAPSTPHRDGVKAYEQLICFWTPEVSSVPARVGLMSIPSKQVIRSVNLERVSDIKLHWQSDADFLCVKVDRHSKSRKSQATTLEIFRVKEKDVPVEGIELKDTVVNFAWEPHGSRFVILTANVSAPKVQAVQTGAKPAPPKTAISFYCPEKTKGDTVGKFRVLRTIENRTSNAIFWNPMGRFVVIATILMGQSSPLEFYDLDYEGEKSEIESEKELAANLLLMGTADHYAVTDVEWDPAGRFVATHVSAWKERVEHGYHIYDFKGELLRDSHVENFKQLLWRPRPPWLLSKKEQDAILKNLHEYSVQFDQEDTERGASADREAVERRRQQLNEWYAWRGNMDAEIAEEREALGLPADPLKTLLKARGLSTDEAEEGQVVEEIVEEVVDEKEEIVT